MYIEAGIRNSLRVSGRVRDEETRKNISEGCKKREYHLVCSNCSREYIGKAWNQKYCEECRSSS